MKKMLFLFLALSGSAFADVYLQPGQSSYVSRETVHCGVDQPREKSFSCSYVACLKSDSILNISALACRTHNGYRSHSKNVWAFSGSEAESQVSSLLSSDRDVVDWEYSSINCY
jgi:hypothetical protein